VDDLRAQEKALAALLRSIGVGVWPDWIDAVVGQRVVSGGEFLAAARNVLGVEDAGGRGGDGLLEEAAVEHLHGAVDGRREHVVGRLWGRH
jgi:hypothetical protein